MINYRKVRLILIVVVLGYLLIIQLIYFAAPNEPVDQFPDDCEKTTNCTRVASFNVRGEELNPLRFNTSINQVHDEIISWIEGQSRTEILTDSRKLIHAVFITLVLRFHDDFYTKLFCDQDQVVVYTHSESRLGEDDLNVNEKRVQSFYNHIEQVSFTSDNC